MHAGVGNCFPNEGQDSFCQRCGKHTFVKAHSLAAHSSAELLATRVRQGTHIKHLPSLRLCILKIQHSSCSAYYQKLPDGLDLVLAMGREGHVGLFQSKLFLNFTFTQRFYLSRQRIKEKQLIYCYRDEHEKGSESQTRQLTM